MTNPNLALLEEAVELLEPLLNEFVFAGGCTTGLLVTDPAATRIRPTRDVDAITELLEPLLNEFVFAGGCTTGLLVTDPAATRIRPSRDVDAITEVTRTIRNAVIASANWACMKMPVKAPQRVDGVTGT